MVYYSIRKDKRTIKAFLVIKDDSSYTTFEGVAKCNPEDEWNPELGKKLARARALMKFKKAQYEGHTLMLNKYADAHQRFEFHLEKLSMLAGAMDKLNLEISNLLKNV